MVSAEVPTTGERWIARAEDYYEAARALATLMGFELEDG